MNLKLQGTIALASLASTKCDYETGLGWGKLVSMLTQVDISATQYIFDITTTLLSLHT